ncbi:peptidase M23 [Mycolicibacterium porcinum]|nr:peptidase M23 [Mycolicibacterium porcinum]
MRFAATVLTLGMVWTWPATARAEGSRLQWPVSPRPTVTRGFDAPSPNWNRGHRGVDLAAGPQQPVYAAGPGTVVFAGVLAGRPVVSLAHPGGLRTSYEPVQAAVRPGQTVSTGQLLGSLLAGHPGCPVTACLHWGAMWGPASDAEYVNPLGLLTETPIRLKPLGG